MLTIILNDNSEYILELNNNPLASYIHKSFKHLQNVPLPFSPYYDYMLKNLNDIKGIIKKLVETANHLEIEIDVSKLSNQEYLNNLHQQYEVGYQKGSNIWLDFHEMIHAIEAYHSSFCQRKEVFINYRDRAGPLEKSFDRSYLQYSTTQVTKGTCYAIWSELGKVPITYWLNNEPDNIQRLCKLAKPWIILKPTFAIALQDIDFNPSVETKQQFLTWFSKYKDQWVDHWHIPNWTPDEMFSVIPIGRLLNIDEFEHKMDSNKIPIKITVQ